jgi:hypothetical protein
MEQETANLISIQRKIMQTEIALRATSKRLLIHQTSQHRLFNFWCFSLEKRASKIAETEKHAKELLHALGELYNSQKNMTNLLSEANLQPLNHAAFPVFSWVRKLMNYIRLKR